MASPHQRAGEAGREARDTPDSDAAPAASPRARVLELQRTAGNAAVARLLRAPVATPPSVPAPKPPAPFTLPSLFPTSEADFVPQTAYGRSFVEARKERTAFIAAGKRGPISYDPDTRNKKNYYGGFDVEYDPAKKSGELKVTLRGAVDFRNGIELDKNNWAIAKASGAETQAAVATINKLPKADRPAAVVAWQWSKQGGSDAGDEAAFLTKYEAAIESAWQGKHQFHCTRTWWEDLGAEVAIDVQVYEKAKDKAKAATDHMLVAAYKVPAGIHMGAFVNREGTAKDAFSNIMVVSSQKVEPRTDHLLDPGVDFDAGKTTIGAAYKKRLKDLAGDMPNAKKGANVGVSDVTVHAAGSDEAERKARYETVKAVLVAGGMAAARIKYHDAGVGDRVRLVIGDGRPQIAVAHEAGHMFGLDDEYVGSGAYGPGKDTEHTEFAKKVGGFTGIQHARSDAIMSGGMKVMTHHYVTFLDALRLVTGMDDWDFGPPRAVSPPSEAGDFPLPPQDGTRYA